MQTSRIDEEKDIAGGGITKGRSRSDVFLGGVFPLAKVARIFENRGVFFLFFSCILNPFSTPFPAPARPWFSYMYIPSFRKKKKKKNFFTFNRHMLPLPHFLPILSLPHKVLLCMRAYPVNSINPPPLPLPMHRRVSSQASKYSYVQAKASTREEKRQSFGEKKFLSPGGVGIIIGFLLSKI